MRRSIAKIKAVLLCRKGESLMESLASLFIYLILLMAITTMIKTALHITSEYTKDAESRQGMVNDAVMENYGATPGKGTLRLRDGGGEIDVTIPVELFAADGYGAFRPEPVT